MEDFEFKPLTEGLGFNKNKVATEETTDTALDRVKWSSKPLEQKGVEMIETDFAPPLPRPEYQTPKIQTTKGVNNTAPTLDELIKNLEKNRLPNEKVKAPTAAQTAVSQREFFATANISLGAGFLDGMLVLALTLLGFIALLSITNADLIKIWTAGASTLLIAASVSVLGLMGLVYYLTSRVFMGFTPGEWAYEQQLGLPTERTKNSYTLRIITRSTLNVVTGFILFPLIAMFLGRDILGDITGAHLYQRR